MDSRNSGNMFSDGPRCVSDKAFFFLHMTKKTYICTTAQTLSQLGSALTASMLQIYFNYSEQ